MTIGTFSIVGTLLLSVVSLVVRWRLGSPTVRLQIKWLLLTGLFFGLQGLIILFDITGVDVLGELLLLAGLIAWPTSVAIAVTRHRLYEIDQIISRLRSLWNPHNAPSGRLHGSVFLIRSLLPIEGQLPVAMSTLAIAALFNPLRRRIQRLVDRRFNRSRYDAELALNAFSEKLRA